MINLSINAMNFEETIQNLKFEKDNALAQECLNEMLNGQILFSPGFEQEAKRLTSLYDLRLRMAKGINKSKFKDDVLSNWSIVVENLKNCSAKKMKLNWVRTESKHFMLFWNAESKKLTGIYYLYPEISIQQQEYNNQAYIQRGYSVESAKYINGKKVKSWK